MRALPIVLAVAVGLLAGVGAFTFQYAQGLSYLSEDPNACINCHIMRPQFDAWVKSSHHAAATCADCHLPGNFVEKYPAKAENGWHHSWAFTFQNFHEPIQVTPRNARRLQQACVGCHEPVVHQMMAYDPAGEAPMPCVHCHASVGHAAQR